MLLELAPYLYVPLDLTGIDQRALDAWEAQWVPAASPGQPWSTWNWKTEAKNWYKCIDRFEVAIWSEGCLCGLAIGKPSDRRNNLSVYLMQGCPIEDHPLKGKILGIVLDVAEAYGTALSCRELRLVQPLRGMLPYYRKLDFRLVRCGKNALPYCVREL